MNPHGVVRVRLAVVGAGSVKIRSGKNRRDAAGVARDS
jgi:hypothetical protein